MATADAERRRLERDLHDGAQQHLVALAVNLRLATDIIADDPAGGMEMLAQMAEDVQGAIREVRELAHGIYPPLLAGGGLAEALRAAANRAAIPVTVTADGVGRYSQDIETAVVLLLPGGAAERRQACTEGNRGGTTAGGIRRAAVLGK